MNAIATDLKPGLDDPEAIEAVERELQSPIGEIKETIQEVSDATDDQAATTEEVASMVDTLVDELDEMAGEIETIAAANEQQTGQRQEIANTASQLREHGVTADLAVTRCPGRRRESAAVR